jgi:pre-mRNA-splicing factor ATP-dependent RNA helicase DHX15/PRP43
MMCAYLPVPLSPLNQSFDFQGELVPLGEVMAEFPLDPQLAKVLLCSSAIVLSFDIHSY